MKKIVENIVRVESGLTDVICTSQTKSENLHNLFGRKVSIESNPASVVGFASGGWRASVVCEMDSGWNLFHRCSKLNLPVLLIMDIAEYSNLENSFSAIVNSSEELQKFSLLAHRIAELSLRPSVMFINSDTFEQTEHSSNLEESAVRDFLKNSSSQIDCPTTAQKIVFGDRRRLIPKWINTDLPGQFAGLKTKGAVYEEDAAKTLFRDSHHREITVSVLTGFENKFGEITQIQSVNSSKSDLLFITYGLKPDTLEGFVKKEKKAGIINISIPDNEEIEKLELGRKKVVVQIVHNERINLLPNLNSLLKNKDCNFLKAIINNTLTTENFKRILDYAETPNLGKVFYPDVAFIVNNEKDPKQTALSEMISRDYTLPNQNTRMDHMAPPAQVPAYIRRIRETGPLFSRHPIFNDFTLSKIEKGFQNWVHPYKSVSWSPLLSSGIVRTEPENLPEINFDACTACGLCYTNCPATAIIPLSLSIESILRSSMKIASVRGNPVAKLTPHIKSIAKSTTPLKNKALPAILEEGFLSFMKKKKLQDDQSQILREEFNILLDSVRNIPIAITDTFYHNIEKFEKGMGQIFSLGIDIENCTACGICEKVCPESVISLEENTAQRAEAIHRTHSDIIEFPDPPDDIIKFLSEDTEFTPFGALLLREKSLRQVSGVKNHHPYGKDIVHNTLSVYEELRRTTRKQQGEKLKSLIGALEANIHKMLEDVLPDKDYNILLKNLKSGADRKTTEILSSGTKKLDSSVLQRKIELLEDLKRLEYLKNEGVSSEGRADVILIVSPEEEFTWLNSYPLNSSCNPVYVFDHPNEIRGIVLSSLGSVIDNIKVLRRAEMEIVDKYIPQQDAAKIQAIEWEDLTDEEKLWSPAFILIATDRYLNEYPLINFKSSSPDQVPFKIVSITDLKIQAPVYPQVIDPDIEFYQTSCFNDRWTYDLLKEGLKSGKFSVFRFLDPGNPFKKPELRKLVYEGGFYPELKTVTRIVEGIEVSVQRQLHRPEQINNERSGTWADYAFIAEINRDEFEEYNGDNSISILNFLKSDSGIPCLNVVRGKDTIHYKVGKKILKLTNYFHQQKQLMDTIYAKDLLISDELKARYRQELSDEKQSEIEAMKRDFEKKLGEKEKEQLILAKDKIKKKLKELLTHAQVKNND